MGLRSSRGKGRKTGAGAELSRIVRGRKAPHGEISKAGGRDQSKKDFSRAKANKFSQVKLKESGPVDQTTYIYGGQ